MKIKTFFRNHTANILTASRLVISAAILILYFTNTSYWMERCLALFALGCLTDMADGAVARKLKSVSNLGKLLDPVCDKAMMLSMMFVLTLSGTIPAWAVIILAAKELIMMIGSLFFLGKKLVVSANWVGKSATVILSIAVALAVFKVPFTDYIFIAGIAWTLVAMIQYGLIFFKQLKTQGE